MSKFLRTFPAQIPAYEGMEATQPPFSLSGPTYAHLMYNVKNKQKFICSPFPVQQVLTWKGLLTPCGASLGQTPIMASVSHSENTRTSSGTYTTTGASHLVTH